MVRRVLIIAVVAVFVLALAATPAVADSERLTTASESTVSGTDALAAILREVERVQIGSSASTVTLQNATEQDPIVLEYSALTGSDGSGQGGNALVPLLTLSVGAAALRSVLRLMNSVSRLGQRR